MSAPKKAPAPKQEQPQAPAPAASELAVIEKGADESRVDLAAAGPDENATSGRRRPDGPLAGVPTTVGEIVAARTTDTDETSTQRFAKVYVMQARAWDEYESAGAEDLHERNKVAVLQEALNLGQHPQEEASFEGVEPKGTKSVELTYSVAVKPASVDSKAIDAVTPSKALNALPGNTTEQSQVREERRGDDRKDRA